MKSIRHQTTLRILTFSILGFLIHALSHHRAAHADPLRSLADSSQTHTVIGTAPRTEVEMKFALTDHKISAQKLSSDLLAHITAMSDEMSFGKTAGCDLEVDRSLQSFAFVDDYFDTSSRDLLHHHASYRLRRRWQKYQHYLRHQLFFWSKLFGATRVEIQSKTGYEVTGDQQLSVVESRLEFRPTASPFNEGFMLPDISKTSSARFHDIVITGQLDGHQIYPYHSLLNHPLLHLSNLNTLAHVTTLVSVRHRFHLSCPHPLGWGPNPDQVFIITIDEVDCVFSCCNRNENDQDEDLSLITIEVERERNTTTYLDEFLIYEQSSFFNNPVAQKAFDYLRSIRSAHKHDHQLIAEKIKSYLQSHHLKIQKPKAKYHRFGCSHS